VLLFQDIAVVPVLVLIPALGLAGANLTDVLGMALLKAAGMLLFLFTLGKWLINPWFNVVAGQRSRELFVMNVLMVTLLLAFATKSAGLSYALGAFIAGMLISETKFRYQVESDIAPFRDILLGLFFISVGMLLNLQQIAANLGLVLLILLAFVLLKAAIVSLVIRLMQYEAGVAIRTGLILAQAGEFSFVILALGVEQHLVSGPALQLVLAAALLSMVLAPFMIQFNGRITRKLVSSYSRNSGQIVQDIDDASKHLHNHVIICGYGRSGQYLGRFLQEESIPFVALDIDPSRVLEAAGAARAKALIISYADNRAAMKILHIVQEKYPQLPVIVRTVDDSNMEALREAGATEVVPEILEGSLMLASHALMLLGVPLHRVVKRIRLFREARYQLFKGYFHGISDAEDESLERQQVRLHSVIISPGSYAIGRRLVDMHLESFEVHIKSIRRPNSNGMVPSNESPLAEGDVIVLLGQPTGLSNAQNALLIGRVANK
jgi:CPA2 family monovalent cation:H+ antiporter-2